MSGRERSIGCVVMAAGGGRRFGGNKLTAAVDGRTLIRRALEAVPADRLARVAVVTRYPEVTALAERFGFLVVENRRPDLGVSHTIALGLEAVGDCGGALFMAADQPLLRRETVAALADLWLAHPAYIVALGHGGVRGSPCLFPARFYPELLALTGDSGGSAVIRRHEDALLLCEASPDQLADADTPEELEKLKNR